MHRRPQRPASASSSRAAASLAARWRLLAAALLAICGLLSASDLRAQEELSPQEELEIARQARQISSEVMSPFCLGRTMSDCPSPAAAAVRDQIRVWLRTGLSEDDIKARLDQEFAGSMASRGFSPTLESVPDGTAGWLVPVLVLVVGAALLALVLVRLQRQPSQQAGISDRELEALEAELDGRLGSRRSE